ncbi:MAG: ATP-binding protein [Erysipelotrichaceae bacterium]|nr:ATP-binding protein [Erysipelotrichaceae bacterium]
MKKKLVLSQSLVLTFALGLVFALGIFFTRQSILEEASSNTIALTNAYEQSYRDGKTDYRMGDDLRLTIIASDGSVIYDSQENATNMENHLNRPEIQLALQGNRNETVTRSSSTLGVDMLYYATEVSSNADPAGYRFLRVSLRLSAVNRYLVSYVPWMALISFLAIALSILFSIYFSSKALAPLRQLKTQMSDILSGNYLPHPLSSHDPEMEPLLVDLGHLASQLDQSLKAQEKEKEKLKIVIDNVQDGIVALDNEKKILWFNPVAQEILEISPHVIGMDRIALTSDPDIQKGLHSTEVSSHFVAKIRGRSYLCSVQNRSDNTLLVLTDITWEKESEERRKEFFDGASHELKTPLTSIKGFNELIALQSKDPVVERYSQLIGKETDRMISLVQDMLSLSELERRETKTALPLPFRPIAEEVYEELAPLAKKRGIQISIQGDASLPIEREDGRSLLKNLWENAIRYNHEGGYAKVTLCPGQIFVSDNGIGIPFQDQDHIFERFYRVDKSRSRQDGGTGLGLSIVKHIAMLYGASVQVKSTLGMGSTFVVTFLPSNRQNQDVASDRNGSKNTR